MRVVIADDSVLFREGVARVLTEAGNDVVGQAGDAAALLAMIESAEPTRAPEVAVIDIRMPPTHTTEGLDAAKLIQRRWAGMGILVLSQYVAPQEAMDLLADARGGIGYLLKDRVSDIGTFVDAVRSVGHGGSVVDPDVVTLMLQRRRLVDPLAALSPRERTILMMMAEGRSNRAIGAALFVTDNTVETHIGSLFTKLSLPPTPHQNRRVLAALMYLRSPSAPPQD
jgi:DNA-binding NarL/FixJ family response regulator